MKTPIQKSLVGPLATGLAALSFAVMSVALGACSVAARPLPAATSHDPGLEAEAMRAFPGLKDTLGMTPSGTPIQARIIGGWNVVQNELTGAPTERTIDIAVAVKDEDGTCSWTSGRYSQQHMGGGSYGELHAEFQLDRGSVDCKSLESSDKGPTTAAPAPAAAGGIGVVGAEGPGAAPAETDAEYAAIVEKNVASLGADAVEECKTYIREMCKRQTGSTRATVCKTYADSIRPTASSSQGSIVCKAAVDGLAR